MHLQRRIKGLLGHSSELSGTGQNPLAIYLSMFILIGKHIEKKNLARKSGVKNSGKKLLV
jgi:hypothetical protein